MTLPTRKLGRNGPEVTAIGLGLMSFAGWYSQKDTSSETVLNFLDKAHEVGERFWDTADVYGASEDIIGEWFKRSGKRSDIFLATKFALGATKDGNRTVSNEPDYIRQACDRSLKRLGVDTIDLYYCHRLDDKTPVEKTVETLAELKSQGKIKYIGLSECSASAIRRAHAVHPITAYQVEYSPLFLDIESEEVKILDTCRELGIGIIAYSPIGRGFLTGQIKSLDDLSSNDFRLNIEKLKTNWAKIQALVDKIQAVADKHKATAAQICLAWIAAQGDDIISIPGTSTIKYLEQNVAAINIKLSDEDNKQIREYAKQTDLPGGRYPPGYVTEPITAKSG